MGTYNIPDNATIGVVGDGANVTIGALGKGAKGTVINNPPKKDEKPAAPAKDEPKRGRHAR
jgi:hypothetical protein